MCRVNGNQVLLQGWSDNLIGRLQGHNHAFDSFIHKTGVPLLHLLSYLVEAI